MLDKIIVLIFRINLQPTILWFSNYKTETRRCCNMVLKLHTLNRLFFCTKGLSLRVKQVVHETFLYVLMQKPLFLLARVRFVLLEFSQP